jgi:tetratricopeptide (TPR) repeat protein
MVRDYLKSTSHLGLHEVGKGVIMTTKKILTQWNIVTTLLIATSVWFIVYCSTTQNVPPLTLFLGWFFLIPAAMLSLIWLVMLALANISALMLARKQFGYAEQCARYNNTICSWWFNLHRLAGRESPGITLAFLRSLVILANCLTASGKIDDEIGIRQQIVESASSSGYYCDAAKSCDFLVWLYRRKKDNVHARHWADRTVGYYERLSDGICACRKEHNNLEGNHAALQAWLADDSMSKGVASAAEHHVQKAMDLISNCSDADAEIALARLMDFFFKSNDWQRFEAIVNRYLAIKHFDDANYLYLAGQALIRLGTIHGEAAKYSQAETELLSGIDLAKRSGRTGLLAKGESALNTLRKKQDELSG